MSEAYIVVIGTRDGARYAERKHLNVPLDLATGNYERLTDFAVREFIHDLMAEDERRSAAAERRAEVQDKCGGYDPFASQIRRQA